MEIEKFVQNFAYQFDEIDPKIVTPASKFRDLEGWSSLVALSIIAMVDEEYNVKVKGDDIKSCSTVEDLFIIVKGRFKN